MAPPKTKDDDGTKFLSHSSAYRRWNSALNSGNPEKARFEDCIAVLQLVEWSECNLSLPVRKRPLKLERDDDNFRLVVREWRRLAFTMSLIVQQIDPKNKLSINWEWFWAFAGREVPHTIWSSACHKVCGPVWVRAVHRSKELDSVIVDG